MVNDDVNTCIQAGLVDNDLFYHAYPGDNTKFIQCDQFGDSFIMSCPPGEFSVTSLVIPSSCLVHQVSLV